MTPKSQQPHIINPNRRDYEPANIKELFEAELNALHNDPLVYPLISEQLHLTKGEAEASIASLLDFQEDVHYCANCPGLGECKKAHPHFVLRLERDGHLIARHYDPCEKILSLADFKKRYIRCSFPEEWRDDDLRKVERSVSARDQALMAMGSLLTGDSGRWIYFFGKAGSGKSYMLACLANQYAKAKGKGAFCDTGDLLTELKELSIKDSGAFNELMKALSTCSILVLDDFGNEYKTEYVYTTVLFPLLNARDKAGLPTAFASDFKPAQIVSMYGAKIGAERAHQLGQLLTRRCGKALDVTGTQIY